MTAKDRTCTGFGWLSAMVRLGLVACLAVCAGCVDCMDLYDDISTMVDESRCRLRVGVLTELEIGGGGIDKAFQKALLYFAERKVDAVVLAGGITKDGTLMQWRGIRKAWEKVFSGESGVALIVVTGERDGEVREIGEGTTSVRQQKGTVGARQQAGVFAREVKGYTFIGANWRDKMGVDAWAVKPYLAQVDGAKPFFYVQNLVPHGTCCADTERANVFDSGKMTYMLAKHPNAVAICGAAHAPLTDESAFWRGAFTCVNAGTFSSAKMRGEDGDDVPSVHHGLVLSVYDNAIVFERFDFGCEATKRVREGVHVEKLGRDWRVELPAKPGAREAMAAPRFWDDTQLRLFPSEKIVSVVFPPVLAKHTGVRAYGYEVKVKSKSEEANSVGERKEDGEERVYGTWSPAFCSCEDRENKPVTVNYPRASLPRGNVRFEVTPVGAFGERGKPIAAEISL